VVRGLSRVGIALSGGIDSIAVACAVRHVAPKCQILSFTAADGPSDPERITAEHVARFVGSEQYSVDVGGEQIAELLPDLIWHLEDPIARTETAQFLALAHAAKGKVDLMITGAGSDGLFAGMPRHKVLWAMNLAPFGMVRRALGEFYDLTQHGLSPQTAMGRLLARAYFHGTLPQPPSVIGSSGNCERSHFPAPGREFLNEFLGPAFCGAVSRWLTKIEKPLASAGIQHLSPFIGRQMAETAFSVPSRYKIRYGREKFVLRRALLSIIPPEVLNVPKAPMKMGHGQALLNAIFVILDRYLTRDRINQRNLFRWPEIEALRAAAERAPRSSETLMRLWTVLLTEIWAETYVDNRGGQPVVWR
jgi:asparagine synthase (glutamine-hydrolysing)